MSPSFDRPGGADTPLDAAALKTDLETSAADDLAKVMTEYKGVLEAARPSGTSERRAERLEVMRESLSNLKAQVESGQAEAPINLVDEMQRRWVIEDALLDQGNFQLEVYRGVLANKIAKAVSGEDDYMAKAMEALKGPDGKLGLDGDLRLVTLTIKAVARERYKFETGEVFKTWNLNLSKATSGKEELNNNEKPNIHDQVMALFIGNSVLDEKSTDPGGLYHLLNSENITTVEGFATKTYTKYVDFINKQCDSQNMDGPAKAALTLTEAQYLILCKRPNNDIQGRLDHIQRARVHVEQALTLNYNEEIQPRIDEIKGKIEGNQREITRLENQSEGLVSRAKALKDKEGGPTEADKIEITRLNQQATATNVLITRLENTVKRQESLITGLGGSLLNRVAGIGQDSFQRERAELYAQHDFQRAMVNNMNPRMRISAGAPSIMKSISGGTEWALNLPARAMDAITSSSLVERPARLRDMDVGKMAKYALIAGAGFGLLVNAVKGLRGFGLAGASLLEGDIKGAAGNLLKVPKQLAGAAIGTIMPMAMIAGVRLATEEDLRAKVGDALGAGRDTVSSLTSRAFGTDIPAGAAGLGRESLQWLGDLLGPAGNWTKENAFSLWESIKGGVGGIPDAASEKWQATSLWFQSVGLEANDFREHFQTQEALQDEITGYVGGVATSLGISADTSPVATSKFNTFLTDYAKSYAGTAYNPDTNPKPISYEDIKTMGYINQGEHDKLIEGGNTDMSTQTVGGTETTGVPSPALAKRLIKQAKWLKENKPD